MGVVNSSWFDRVLFSVLYMIQNIILTDVQTPFLGTPLVPLKTATTAATDASAAAAAALNLPTKIIPTKIRWLKLSRCLSQPLWNPES